MNMSKHRRSYSPVPSHRRRINTPPSQRLVRPTMAGERETRNSLLRRLGHAARRPGYFYWNVYFLIVRLARVDWSLLNVNGTFLVLHHGDGLRDVQCHVQSSSESSAIELHSSPHCCDVQMGRRTMSTDDLLSNHSSKSVRRENAFLLDSSRRINMFFFRWWCFVWFVRGMRSSRCVRVMLPRIGICWHWSPSAWFTLSFTWSSFSGCISW